MHSEIERGGLLVYLTTSLISLTSRTPTEPWSLLLQSFPSPELPDPSTYFGILKFWLLKESKFAWLKVLYLEDRKLKAWSEEGGEANGPPGGHHLGGWKLSPVFCDHMGHIKPKLGLCTCCPGEDGKWMRRGRGTGRRATSSTRRGGRWRRRWSWSPDLGKVFVIYPFFYLPFSLFVLSLFVISFFVLSLFAFFFFFFFYILFLHLFFYLIFLYLPFSFSFLFSVCLFLFAWARWLTRMLMSRRAKWLTSPLWSARPRKEGFLLLKDSSE